MSKPLKKQEARLSRRQSGHTSDPKNARSTRRPGSMNPHKSQPINPGSRSKTQIQADSQKATAR